MGQILNNDFSAGWVPSDDSLNGRKSGSIQFSNLTLDELGAVTLAKGTSKVNSAGFSNDVNSIYSRVINGTKHRYVGVLNGDILKDTGAGTFATTVLTDASTEKAAYGTAFGQVFACKGTQRKKDNGSTIRNLGVGKPTAQVTIAYPTPPSVDVSGVASGPTDYRNWESVESSVFGDTNTWVNFDLSATTFRGIVQVPYGGGVPVAIDTTVLSGGSVGTEDDTFFMDINIQDDTVLTKVRLEFYLAYPGTGVAPADPSAGDYFFFEWLNDDNTPFIPGAYQQTTLKARRGDFTKVGDTSSLNWKSINTMRLIVEGTAVISVAANNMKFQGGTKGPLSGTGIEYTQVNVYNSGSYLAASEYGPISAEILDLDSTYLNITPQDPAAIDSQVNEVWIYRRGGGLDRWYRVKTQALPTALFSDQLSNEDALLLGETLDESLISVQTIPDAIRSIEGPFFGRVLYMTYKEIYVSLDGNPDTCNVYATLLTSGSLSEMNLFITKVSNSVILLGTTNDIYEISGTLSSLPDGTIDVSIRPLGLSKPPISDAFVNDSGTLIYMAEDGWRVLRGNQVDILTGDLDLLYRGITRYGTSGVNILAQNNIQFSCCLSKGRFFTSQFLLDGSSTCFVYHFPRPGKNGYWRKYNFAVNQLFAEEDGTVLGGYYGGGSRFLKVLDTGTSIDGSAGLPIIYQSLFFDDNLPRNRKDSFTLKLLLDSGNTNLTLKIYKDQSTTPITISTTLNGNGTQEKFFDLATLVGIAKSYQLEITGTTATFKLLNWSIDYEARPTPLTYLRIPPTNWGTDSRKRIPELSILIDTLGQTPLFTPYLDNVAQVAAVIPASTDKTTYVYQFTSDVSATDISGVLSSAFGDIYFEYYGLVQPREIEVLPDPLKFKHIPYSNLGTHSRKRITAIALIIDTRGVNVTFTPRVDGVNQATSVINTAFKQTYVHYFTSEVVGVDIGGTLTGTSSFEYYGIDLNETISEKLPPPTKFLIIPQDNYGTSARKRFSSFKFQINTKGQPVTFTPRIDGVDQPAQNFTTSERRTVEYFFSSDTIGIDIGGTLSGATEFEFFGTLRPRVIEELPERLTFFIIPESNFGIAAKKRVRTLPLLINTNSADVIFTPIVDGVRLAPTNLNTNGKVTTFHYFNTDIFGVDFKGELSGTSAFEFYGMLKPEDVEVIPVGKRFDQIGPVEFNKLGKLISFRLRVLPTGTDIPYAVFMEDTNIASGHITVIANKEAVYEVRLAKSINGTICRIEFGAADVFHRWECELKVNLSGSATESKLFKVR